jgi:predicted O-linked N-acetylglucosamine transferase (SPINDLY family)
MSKRSLSAAEIAEMLRQGVAHHRDGRRADAQRMYRAILQHDPTEPNALHLMGILAGEAGHFEAAVDLMQRALKRDSENAQLHNNLGEALRNLDRYHEAFESYQRALKLDPKFAQAFFNAGDAAKVCARQAQAAGQAEAAREFAHLAAESLNGFGVISWRQNRAEKAEAAYRDALSLEPKNISVLNNLALLLGADGRYTEAAELLRQAVEVYPEFAEAHGNLGSVLLRRGELDAAIAAIREAAALKSDYKAAISAFTRNRLMNLIYKADVSGRAIFEAHREWGLHFAAEQSGKLGQPAPFLNTREAERRLRIGYLSPDFRRHSVSYFFEPLLSQHDLAAVETYCYSNVEKADDVTQRLQGLAQHWRPVFDQDDDALRKQIRSDRIDILVDLAGHTGNNRLPALFPKPAPVIVTWLGYPATTGLPTVDYRLTDKEADPPGEADELHTETLIRLEGGFLCYRPPADAPAVAPAPSLDRGFVTFGSFNNPTKLTDEGISIWARILREIPTARLLLKGVNFEAPEFRETKIRFRDGFAKAGIEESRVELRGHTETTAEHLATYGEVDVGLDPFPYNGTTTTCEALWMGVPVVALAGDRHSGRVGLSLLTRVGLPDLIAQTPERYVAIATELARDPARLASLRASIRDRMAASPLRDEPGFARRFEAMLRDIWRQWCRLPQ